MRICDEKGVEFFITADQTERILIEVLEIGDNAWNLFNNNGKKQGNEGGREGKKRKKRKNHKKAVAMKRNPTMKFKGRAEVASFVYQPIGWEKAYRCMVKRTEIVDKNNQLYLNTNFLVFLARKF